MGAWETDLLSPAPPGVACSVILMYTFCTDCWLIAVLYFTWLAFDWNTPKKGKRLLSCLCSSRTLTSWLCTAAAPPPGCCLFLWNTYSVKDLG